VWRLIFCAIQILLLTYLLLLEVSSKLAEMSICSKKLSEVPCLLVNITSTIDCWVKMVTVSESAGHNVYMIQCIHCVSNKARSLKQVGITSSRTVCIDEKINLFNELVLSQEDTPQSDNIVSYAAGCVYKFLLIL